MSSFRARTATIPIAFRRVETAPDGSLIAFAEARKYNGATRASASRTSTWSINASTNNGATWSPMTVLETRGELWSAANPATVVDRSNGRLWVFYLRSQPGLQHRHVAARHRRHADDRPLERRQRPDLVGADRLDGGRPGHERRSWRASVAGPGGAIQTRKGRLIVPMWKTPFANFAIFTDDHGRTWQRGQIVPETGRRRKPDGRTGRRPLLMDIRQKLRPAPMADRERRRRPNVGRAAAGRHRDARHVRHRTLHAHARRRRPQPHPLDRAQRARIAASS